MPIRRTLYNRGAKITVLANAEVLFLPGADVAQFNRRMSSRLRAFAAQEAPSNKRPRWGHYGKPLKATMRAATQNNPAAMKAWSAVGSTAPHALYVDQGTGIYGGGNPYQAMVLPPWFPGSPSLYEHTWRPTGEGRVRPITIKGQRGQFFFDKALRRAFIAMRLPSVVVPNADYLSTFPARLSDFSGNTVPDAGFQSSLDQWRAWRDGHYNSGRTLGRTGISRERRNRRVSDEKKRQNRDRRRSASRKYSDVGETDYERARRQARQAEASKRYRRKNADAIKRRRIEREREQARGSVAKQQERNRFLLAARRKYGKDVLVNSLVFRDGYWYVTIREKGRGGIVREREIRGRQVT